MAIYDLVDIYKTKLMKPTCDGDGTFNLMPHQTYQWIQNVLSEAKTRLLCNLQQWDILEVNKSFGCFGQA